MKQKKMIVSLLLSIMFSASVSAQNNDIEVMNAAIVHPDGPAYFLVGQYFYEYNMSTDRLIKTGIIGKDGWSGLPTNVDAALFHPTNYMGYIFKGNQYHRYNFKAKRVEKTGTIGVDGWNGLQGPIDAAVVHPINKMAYFFKGTKYYRFNFSLNKVDKIGIIGKDGWKGVPSNPDAAIEHKNGKVYFFKGDNYYRYDFAKENVDKTGMIGKDGWQGLFANIDAANNLDFFKNKSFYYIAHEYKRVRVFEIFSNWKEVLKKLPIGSNKYEGIPSPVDAALTHPTNHRIYLFKGTKYYRYDKSLHKVDKIGTIGGDGWKGVPADIDAACLSSNGRAYFFKGAKYYRFDFKTETVDKVALIKDNWKGIPDNLDAAQTAIDDEWSYYDENIILFYKKSIEYVYDVSKNKVIGWNLIPDGIIN